MVVGGPCLARRRVKGVARPAPAQRTAGSFDPLPAYALQGGALRLAGILVRLGVEASALSR